MMSENPWYFMKSKNQHAKRTNTWYVIVVVVEWLIALALIYIVIVKFRILTNNFMKYESKTLKNTNSKTITAFLLFKCIKKM